MNKKHIVIDAFIIYFAGIVLMIIAAFVFFSSLIVMEVGMQDLASPEQIAEQHIYYEQMGSKFGDIILPVIYAFLFSFRLIRKPPVRPFAHTIAVAIVMWVIGSTSAILQYFYGQEHSKDMIAENWLMGSLAIFLGALIISILHYLKTRKVQDSHAE